MSVARLVVFTFFMVGVLTGINVQVFRWARNAFGLGGLSGRVLKAALVLSVAGMVLGRVADRFWPNVLTHFIIAVASTVQLAAVISGILLLLADAVRFLWRLPGRLRTRLSPSPPPAAESAPSVSVAPTEGAEPVAVPRRALLTQAVAGSAFLIGSSSSLYGSLKGRYDYVLEELPVTIPGLSRALDGFSIAQLSDVHIGVYVGDAELAIAEELLRQAKPDLIVLTGDLLDNDPRLAGRLGRFVRRLTPLARHGVFAISGNHDYFAGVDDVANAVRGAGARMLRNDGLIIGEPGAGFALLGVDDVWARREGLGPDLPRAVNALPKVGGRIAPARDLPRVLLCHNPSFFAESAGQVALQMSGHTHGGQVNLGIRPADYLLPGGWVAGRYDLNGSALYVNRGFGTVGPPARIGAPPEVTRLVLRA
ncbi:MAG TPA: metallophosphoesterase [Polyangiaceae bacterium]|nr:metallophosphoesterase [Polyangiaceae bacterium]